MKLRTLFPILALALLLMACPPADETTPTPDETPTTESPEEMVETAPVTASATLMPRADQEGLSGSVTFTAAEGGVEIMALVSGATPGEHGFHIHEIGDCSADDFTSSGGHFNPAGTDHGAPGADPSHAGDFGNITIGEDGSGTLSMTSADITLGDGENSVIGRAVVLHEGTDDLTSQPTGAAGGRIACGVIAQGGEETMDEYGSDDGMGGGEETAPDEGDSAG